MKKVEADRLLDLHSAAICAFFSDIPDPDIAAPPEIVHVLLLGCEQPLEPMGRNAVHSPLGAAAEFFGRRRVDYGPRYDPWVPAAARIPRAVHGRFLAAQRYPGQGYQRRTHKAQHCGDPASDPLQPFSYPAGLSARRRRGRASEGPDGPSV